MTLGFAVMIYMHGLLFVRHAWLFICKVKAGIASAQRWRTSLEGGNAHQWKLIWLVQWPAKADA